MGRVVCAFARLEHSNAMSHLQARFAAAMDLLPLVAILRGLSPHEAVAIGAALTQAGFVLLEVPLNSPHALDSIGQLARAHPNALVGAGTVLTPDQVRQVHAVGGQLIVSPHFNAEVLRAALALGMLCLPGVLTPSEAFSALAAGAHGLKLFPAEIATPAGLKALRAVLPPATRVLPVGGINPSNMGPWRAAGADGFGIGSALYRPGKCAAAVHESALEFAAAFAASPRA